MSINITVGGVANKQQPDNQQSSLLMNARKSIDGHIMILDHNDIDIVMVPQQKKIIVFPKSSLHDSVYSCQDRLFNYLANKGVIKRESVQAGDVYGSIQAEYPDAVNNADASQLVLFIIGKFLEEEKPHIAMEEYVEEEFEERMTKPDEAESTDLGEIPHSAKKGTINPSTLRRYIAGTGPY